MNNKYIIKEDYHGDIKLTKNGNTKKVSLSKPTDILDHRVKPQVMPTVYTNYNPASKRVCLTKPEDIKSKEEKSTKVEVFFGKIVTEEKLKQKQRKVNVYLIITILVSLIPIVAYAVNDGLEFQDAIKLLILPTILICGMINNKK